ncbi:MAG: hypothetical protein ACE5DM_02800 [Candidatus Nanoarchaeia archaeon]
MSDMKLLKEEPISMAEMKEAIKAIKKRDEELNFRSGKTEDYLNNFAALKPKEAVELSQKIRDLNVPRLKEEYITKLVDLLPDHPEEVKSTLQGYTITVTKENLKKIADVIKEFRK